MAIKKQTTTNDLQTTLGKLRSDLVKIRLEIRGGKSKNTNAHKQLKKQIAQTLTKKNQENL